tara:strand:+ start:28889 stop:32680 length:3792 start_codon:yes stop_codon:yes gene_type:complete
VKTYKKLILGFATFLVISSLVFLDSNYWKNFLVKKANETASIYGWEMDIKRVSGHLLGKTQFFDIMLFHSKFDSIYIDKLDINIGIIKSLFGLPTLDLLFAESVSFKLSKDVLEYESKKEIPDKDFQIPLNIKSFYCSGNMEIISDKKETIFKTVISGELIGGSNPVIFFDMFHLDLLNTLIQEVNLKSLELSYISSNIQFNNLIGTFLGLPLMGSFKIDNKSSLIEGKIKINDFNIPEELFTKLPLKTKFSNFSGAFDFYSDFKNYSGELSLTNGLGLNMMGEFHFKKLNNKSWTLKNLLLKGENSELLMSGLLSQDGRINSYLNLKNLDLARWIDHEDISTNLTGLAILDGDLTPDGYLEQIDLTLEVLETEYLEVGETSFHGQLSYKDSILTTTSPVMLLIDNSRLTLDGYLNFKKKDLNIIADLENADIELINQFLPGNFNSGKATGGMQITGPFKSPSATTELICNNIVYDSFFLESLEFNSRMDVKNDSSKGTIDLKVSRGTWKDNSFQSGTVDAIIDNGKVIIENCHFKSGDDYFQISGKYDGLNSYIVDRIQVAFEKNYLVNSYPISFSLIDTLLRVDPFELHINDGILEGVISGGHRSEGHIKMSNFDASVIAHFIHDQRLNISGIVFGEILVRERDDEIVLDVDISLKKGIYMREPFDEMNISFLYKDEMIHIDDISMTRGKTFGVQANGVIPLMIKDYHNAPISLNTTFTNLPLSLISNIIPDYYALGGLASGSLFLNQHSAKGKKTQFDYDIDIINASFDLISLGNVKVSGDYDGEYFNIDQLSSVYKEDLITSKGSIPFDLNLVSKNFGSISPNGIFSLKTKGDLYSLYFLSPYVSDLDSVRGKIEIELNIEGKAESLKRNGKISISNGTMSTLLIDDDITNIEGQAEIINNHMIINYFNAYTNHSNIGIQKLENNNINVSGSIDFSQFFSPSYNLTVKANEVSFKTLPIDIIGVGNVDILISGKDTVNIEGIIETLDAKVFYEFLTTEVGETLPQGSGTIISYNLNIPIRGQALFQNSQIDAKVGGELNLNQIGNQDMNFGGEIFVDDGNVFAYMDNFKGLQGHISFDNKGFNPVMNLVAHTDIDDERINLRIIGSMTDLDIVLESASGFSESDILELLTWGNRFEDQGMSSTGFGTQTVSILGSILENQLEKNLREMPGMMAMNLVDDIDISGTASLINPDTNEKFEVAAKRKIGDKTYLNLSYIRSFSLTNNTQIGVEYKLNRHFSVVGNIDNTGSYSVKYRYRYAY